MSKWLLKTKAHGVITLDNKQCEKGDVFVVETYGYTTPTPQDIAKSVGKTWTSSFGRIPDPGIAKVGETKSNSDWEITRIS